MSNPNNAMNNAMNTETMHHGKTSVTVTHPWGLYRPYGHRLLCSDGVIRAARLSATADTFFSVPASLRVNGKHVSGYMTVDEGPDGATRAYTFRHHDKHADKLPAWPAFFERGTLRARFALPNNPA